MKTCSFKNSNINSLHNPNITFFHFRKSDYKLWMTACNNDVLQNKSNYVCLLSILIYYPLTHLQYDTSKSFGLQNLYG